MDLGLLIELVQPYPHIYDMRHRNYKNNEVKRRSWEEIAYELNVSVDYCKRRWKNLQDRFIEERRGSRKSTWHYYNAMLFYDAFITPRKTVSATPKASRSAKSKYKGECRPESSCSSSYSDSSRSWSSMDDLQTEASTSRYTARAERRTPPPEKRRKKEEAVKSLNEKFASYIGSRLNEFTVRKAKQKRQAILLLLEEA